MTYRSAMTPTTTIDPSVSDPAAPRTNGIVCPKCGRQVDSLHCGHCGSQLPGWQADLYGATVRQLAKMGGIRADTGNQGGANDNQPKDNGGASTPPWLFDRCNHLAMEACGEPITLDVAAAEWNHKCDRYYTEDDDALEQDWDATAAWLNPPFSATVRAQRKRYSHEVVFAQFHQPRLLVGIQTLPIAPKSSVIPTVR